jgi:hypothetical protein
MMVGDFASTPLLEAQAVQECAPALVEFGGILPFYDFMRAELAEVESPLAFLPANKYLDNIVPLGAEFERNILGQAFQFCFCGACHFSTPWVGGKSIFLIAASPSRK